MADEPPAKRAHLSDNEERFTDMGWFNAEIRPRLGPATLLVLRLVCKRFYAWCRPVEPFTASAVLADIMEHGLAEYHHAYYFCEDETVDAPVSLFGFPQPAAIYVVERMSAERPSIIKVRPIWEEIASRSSSVNHKIDAVEYVFAYIGRSQESMDVAIECFLLTEPDALVALVAYANNYGVSRLMLARICHWITQPSFIRRVEHFPACVVALVPENERLLLFTAFMELLCVILHMGREGDVSHVQYLTDCRDALSFWRYTPEHAKITPKALVRILVLAVQIPVYWNEMVGGEWIINLKRAMREKKMTADACLLDKEWFTITPEQRAQVGDALSIKLPAEQAQKEISLIDAARAILYDI